MNQFLEKINKPLYKHILFWVAVFLFYTTSARERFDTTEEIIITYFFHVVYQIIIAYTILYFIVPKYQKRKNILETVLLLALLFFIINCIHVTVRMYFLEPAYPNCYKAFLDKNGYLTFTERIFNWKYIFIHLPLFYLQPLFFLVALQFYEKQQQLSKISEQKKIVELKALKHQLNPHFLFNTLNNLYLLAVEKSDKTPDVIEKLSDILDYMLYGCYDTFVPLDKEVKLIKNYLALEQIRYEDRVLISFKNTITEPLKIAPLLLLTFIENAFKHGVKHELKIAKVEITLSIQENDIVFTIFNTKPLYGKSPDVAKKAIGLKNIKQQLDLLYPNAHSIHTENKKDSYLINLKLEKR